MSVTDKVFLEEELCKKTKIKYFELENFAKIGFQPYTVESHFHFTCKMMGWANEKLRLVFYLGIPAINEKIIGKQIDTRLEDEINLDRNNLADNEDLKESPKMQFKRGSRFKNQISLVFDDLFKGNTVNLIICSVDSDELNNKLNYNGWIFEDKLIWESFWLASSTNVLYNSMEHELGKNSIEIAKIRGVPTKIIKKFFEADTFLGIPMKYYNY